MIYAWVDSESGYESITLYEGPECDWPAVFAAAYWPAVALELEACDSVDWWLDAWVHGINQARDSVLRTWGFRRAVLPTVDTFHGFLAQEAQP